MGHSSPPRRGCCLPRRSGLPRGRKATPRQAYDYLRPVLWPVWGLSLGSVCDCLWLASGAIV